MIGKMVTFKILALRSQFNLVHKTTRKNLEKNIYYGWKGFKWFHTSTAYYKSRDKIKTQQEIDIQARQRAKPLVGLWYPMTVKEICDVFKISKDIVKISLPDADLNEALDRRELIILARKMHKRCVFIKNPNSVRNDSSEKLHSLRQPPPEPKDLVKRPPVVTVMGHVDHGKTTLLDALRNTFVVEQEFGGITQHIGAFSVQVKSGERITFIDTPGHAAFTTMRSRGAEVTDLVVLVIAADDGIMDQTIESIRIANKAHVKMIVAVNKIDKPNAMSVDGIKEQLLEQGIQVEDKGGDVQIVPISALKKINLDLLVEMILVEAEVMNLRADPKGLVEGVVIESKMSPQGPVVTVIIKRGTLRKGKILIAGKALAKVRSLKDENGKDYEEAPPSTPVQILGWRSLPEAGDEIFEVKSEKHASKFIKEQKKVENMKKQEEDRVVIEEKAQREHERIRNENIRFKMLPTYMEKKKFVVEKWERERKKSVEYTGPTLNVLVKGDVHGTIEVLLEILATYDKHHECKLGVVDAGVGEITQTDLDLAETFNAIIYGFNVSLHSGVREMAKEKRIDIRFHNVIYKMVDDLKMELTSRLLPKDEEKIIGEADINQNFLITVKNKKKPVAGCKCVSGELVKNGLYKIMREEEVIYQGKLVQMKHLKTDVNRIKADVECGLMFDSFSGEFKPLDRVICYEIVKIPQKTSWNPGF